METKLRTSKYIGRDYNGWIVIDRIVDRHSSSQGTHSTFVLVKNISGLLHQMTLSDREMTKLEKGKSITKTIDGKSFCVDKNVNVARNIVKVVGLF